MKESVGVKEEGVRLMYKGRTSYTTMWLALCRLSRGRREGEGPVREGAGPRREEAGTRREGGGARREGAGPRREGAGGKEEYKTGMNFCQSVCYYECKQKCGNREMCDIQTVFSLVLFTSWAQKQVCTVLQFNRKERLDF